MPVHEWTKVDAGTFHDFHNGWIIHLKEALNGGLLPDGYYAMSEQYGGAVIADVMTLQAPLPPAPPVEGGWNRPTKPLGAECRPSGAMCRRESKFMTEVPRAWLRKSGTPEEFERAQLERTATAFNLPLEKVIEKFRDRPFGRMTHRWRQFVRQLGEGDE